MINIVELLERIPAKGFELNLVKVELNKGDHIIKGAGRLAQNDQYELILTVINGQAPEYDQEVHLHLMSLNDYFNQTRIVSKADYYELAAEDEFGNRVTCEYVDLQATYRKRVYKARLRFNLWIKPAEILAVSHINDVKIYFRNQYDFARFHDVWEIKHPDFHIALKKKDKYLELELFSSNQTIDQGIINQVTESLDFVMGSEHEFDYRVYTGEKLADWQIEVSYTPQAPISKTTFTPPYRRTGSQGNEETVNNLLFRHYYQFLKNNPNSILPKWHKRIVDSGTGYYYKHGMILSVGIEKLLRVYFPYEQTNTADFNEAEISKLFQFSTTLLDVILRNKLEAFIKSLSNQNYVPKRMLSDLEQKRITSQGSTKSWTQLRNKYAHGSDYNDDMRQAIDLVRKNVTLYYELIFHTINYRGRYTSYFQPSGGELINYPPDNI